MTPEEEERYLRQLELGIDEMLEFMGRKPVYLPNLDGAEKETYLRMKAEFDRKRTDSDAPGHPTAPPPERND